MKAADLKAKTILGITGAIVIVAVVSYFSEWILFLPALLGLIILISFGKDDVSRFIGFLTLKPIVSTFLGLIVSPGKIEGFSYLSNEVILALLWTVPELLLTLMLARIYRHLFNSDRIVLLSLIGDIIRWVSLTIVFLLPDPFPEPYFYPQLYILAFFLVFFPSLYAISGLIVVIRRANINRTVNQMAN